MRQSRQRSKKAPQVLERQLQTLKVKFHGEEKGGRLPRRLSIDSGAAEPVESEFEQRQLLDLQPLLHFEPVRVLCKAPQGQKNLAGREEEQI